MKNILPIVLLLAFSLQLHAQTGTVKGKITAQDGFGLGANFVTERFGSIVNGPESPLFPGYELVDAAVYYQVEKFRIQLNTNNIFDKTHWVGGYDFIRAFPGAPRNIMDTVFYTF